MARCFESTQLYSASQRLLHTICSSVTNFLNPSNSWGKFPEVWKCFKVRALFECSDRSNPTNYRPISILPTLSKIMEKVAHSQFYAFLKSHDLFFSKQFGFRPKYSKLYQTLRTRCNKYGAGKSLWRSVFRLDYKAFDTVDHCVLLSMLVMLLEIGVSPSFTLAGHISVIATTVLFECDFIANM